MMNDFGSLANEVENEVVEAAEVTAPEVAAVQAKDETVVSEDDETCDEESACEEEAEEAPAPVDDSGKTETASEPEKKEDEPKLVLPVDADFVDVETGDVLKDATDKLKRELEKYASVPEGLPYQTLSWLIKQLPGDPVLCERVMWRHKTFDECMKHIYSKAADIAYKQMVENLKNKSLKDSALSITVQDEKCAAVGFSMADDITFCHAIEFYRIDDLEKVKAEAVKKAKEEFEKAKAKKNAPKTSKPDAKKKAAAKGTEKKQEKKEEAKPIPQMSMFDMMED